VKSSQTDLIRVRDLDPAVLRVIGGFAFSSIGSGLTMPFLYYYLAHIRDFQTQTVGLVFAWMGLLGFCAAGPVGTLIDRWGPRRIMIGGLLIEALSVAAIGWISTVWQGVFVASVMVLGTTGLWPASTALLTRMVPEEARERVYGWNFMMLNAGLGLGGLMAALIIRPDSLVSFQRLYVIDALTYLVYIAVLLLLPKSAGDLPEAVASSEETAASWRLVLADRAMLQVVGASVLAVTFGYAQMEAGFAAYAVEQAQVPPNALGLAYGANTAVIVVGQLWAFRLIAGRRRTQSLMVACLIWSASWVIIAAAGELSTWWAVVAITVGLGLFGFGETLWAPTAPAVVNALAREDLRGRYNALLGMTWTVSSIIGPALGGMLLGNQLASVWVGCVVGGTLVAALAFYSLGRNLTNFQQGLSDNRQPAPAMTD
jgi:MFS family permease